MTCTMSRCLCAIGNDTIIATTSVQDCPQHGESGYHPDVAIWDCHEPVTSEFPGYAYPVPRPGSVVSTPRNACPEGLRLSLRCDLDTLRQQVQQERKTPVPDTQPETPADRIAAFLDDAQKRYQAFGETDAFPALLAAVGKVLELHHETAGKCATCLGYWPCGEWLALSRELLDEGQTDG